MHEMEGARPVVTARNGQSPGRGTGQSPARRTPLDLITRADNPSDVPVSRTLRTLPGRHRLAAKAPGLVTVSGGECISTALLRPGTRVCGEYSHDFPSVHMPSTGRTWLSPILINSPPAHPQSYPQVWASAPAARPVSAGPLADSDFDTERRCRGLLRPPGLAGRRPQPAPQDRGDRLAAAVSFSCAAQMGLAILR